MNKIKLMWIGLIAEIMVLIGLIVYFAAQNSVWNPTGGMIFGLAYIGTFTNWYLVGYVAEYTSENFLALTYEGELYGGQVESRRGMGTIPVEEILSQKEQELRQLEQLYPDLDDDDELKAEYQIRKEEIEKKYALLSKYLLPEMVFIRTDSFMVITAYDAERVPTAYFLGKIPVLYLDGIQGKYDIDGVPVFLKTKLPKVTENEAEYIESLARENTKLKSRLNEMKQRYEEWVPPETYQSVVRERDQLYDTIEQRSIGYLLTGAYDKVGKPIFIPKPTRSQMINMGLILLALLGLFLFLFLGLKIQIGGLAWL